MRLRSVVLWIVASGAVVGCHPKPLPRGVALGSDAEPMRTVARLTCPHTVGGLVRTGQASDGQSCSYAGPRSEDVKLLLAPLGGQTADARLTALDAGLKAEAPEAAADGPGHGAGVYIASDGARDQAHIDLPGFHLNASGGKASIHMPGVNIDADNDDARVTTGGGALRGATVTAHGGGAEIRTGGVGANGADVTYLLASDTPGPTGYRVVGYLAKGPVNGPLVVGEFRLREHEDGDEGHGEHGLDRLVNLNVHG